MPRKARRRGAGEGTVYPRKDGRWVAELTLEDEKRKYFYAPTQAEALQKLQQAQYEMKQGILATGPKQKVGDYLDYWLDQVHKRTLSPNTYVLYRTALSKHILPALGQMQLQKLTMRQIQMFYNKKLDEGLSPGYIHCMQKVLHGALKQAVKERLLSGNPSQDVSIPSEEKRKVPLLTVEQAKRLLAASQGTSEEPIVVLALTVGMRHGEILTLHWEDVDFESGVIHVRRTLTRDENRKYIEGDDPKTASSERKILLPQFTCEILKAHRTRQRAMQLKAGPAWQHNNLICCTRDGKLLKQQHVLERFYRLLKKEGLPRVHIHDLRHSAASLLDSMGVSHKVIQEILGHSELGMTGIYLHALPSMQKEAAEKMNELFQKPS